jgi:hypothetical protein
MKGKRFAVTVLAVILAGLSTFAQAWFSIDAYSVEVHRKGVAMAAAPDLKISEFVFPADSDKAVRVHVVNAGGAASPLCILRLTVRKINGVPAGRVAETKLSPLAPGKDRWLVINAKSILPNNLSLASTTFKLNADATSIVTESDEANNEVWHNL